MLGKKEKKESKNNAYKVANEKGVNGFDIPELMTKQSPEEEERMHQEELRKIFSAMDQNDWEIAIQYIPYIIVIDWLRKELKEKDRWKEKIEEITSQFLSNRPEESTLKTQIIWGKE